jgi:hypothetical protein
LQLPDKENGYVALLDVLGFRELVRGDVDGERIDHYLQALRTAISNTEVKSVVFSDSIVLTVESNTEEAFLSVARACSRSMGALLSRGIALRGAISFGKFLRRQVGDSVFIAGRAIIEAYEFEQAQNWAGIMVAPSAIKQLGSGINKCRVQLEMVNDLNVILPNLHWIAYIKHWPNIPFAPSSAGECERFDGFVIVPSIEALNLSNVRTNINEIRQRLTELRSIAPSPQAQRKYKEALELLRYVETDRAIIAGLAQRAGRSDPL